MSTISNKIKDLNDLAKIVTQERAKKRKIVHCHGVFDLLHIGHIRYFEQARQMGDVLIVTLTPDKYVDKGPTRPAFSEKLRAEALASLNYIDYVAINLWPTAEETLRLLKPDIYVKGSEFKNTASDMTEKIAKEEAVIREIGGILAFTDDIVFSSTNLINRFFSSLSEELQEYLHVFRSRYSLSDIFEILEKMQNLKVLVVGDAILDDYHFCEMMGTSSKDPALAIKFKSNDIFAGGSLAVSNHVASFVGEVSLLTVLGQNDSHEDFICSQLNPRISPHFIYQEGAVTTIKRRFIEGYSLNKLLEVYIIDDSGLSLHKNAEACRYLEEKLSFYDVVIAADFGHGAISNEMVQILAKHSKFLAVNTQANAGNRGFNTISRYPRADYVSIAEHEIRLEKRNSSGPLRPIIQELIESIGCKQFVVTCGRKGAIVADSTGGYVNVPAFANNIVDRVGAGDAFFAITAMVSALNVPNEILGFIGNIAGALAVEVVGNKKPIEKMAVKKFITSLMK